MAQASAEGKQPRQHLRHLAPIHERPESCSEDGQHSGAQLCGIPKADVEHRVRAETVGAEQEHKVGGRQVQVYVFRAQEGGKQQT